MGAEHAARPGDTELVFLDSRIPASSLFVHRNTIRYRLTRFAELTNELVLAWWLLSRVAPPVDTPNK
jgi:PucR C-terminal helix-turn-helix domain